MTPGERQARAAALVQAAVALVRESDQDGCPWVLELVERTGLSREGVLHALREHLETHPSYREIALLAASAGTAPRVHVVLSANVFVGALRALALAVAAAPQVVVRTSRREPVFARTLMAAVRDPALRESVDFDAELAPRAGEVVHLYGADATMVAICEKLPDDVRVRAHGSGLGVAVIGEEVALAQAAAALAQDMVAFDQQGCLSPRVALVPQGRGPALAAALAEQLQRWEVRVPVGRGDVREREARTRYLDTVAAIGDVLVVGQSAIGTAQAFGPPLVPPTGRNLHIAECENASAAQLWLQPLARFVAAVGLAGAATHPLVAVVPKIVPDARFSRLGLMQRPRFDGPVDRRHAGELTPRQVCQRFAR